MLRQIIVVFLSLAVLVMPRAWAADRGALFKVTGNGHTMHLFGTMHMGKAEFYPLEPRITQALAEASALAVEVDVEGDPAALAATMKAHGMRAEGEPGYKSRDPAFVRRLERATKAAGIDIAATDQFKPWMTAMMLGISDYVALGYNPGFGLDLRLAQMARQNKIRVIELESIGAQLSLFSSIGNEEQWRLLEETVAMIESGEQRKDARMITDAWANADKAVLDALALRVETETSSGARFMQKKLLEERNGPMADKLALLLAQQDKTVAAVGVLHLVGKHSIPAKLSARGLKVERIY